MLIRLFIVMFLVTAGTACKHNKRANTTVRHRAMFDFPCAESGLTLTVVDTEGARGMASQIAVHGCEKKAVYAYYPASDTWLLNGVVAPMPPDFEAPSHVTKGKHKKKDDKKAAKAEDKGDMKNVDAAPVEGAPAVPATPVEPEAPAPTVPEPS